MCRLGKKTMVETLKLINYKRTINPNLRSRTDLLKPRQESGWRNGIVERLAAAKEKRADKAQIQDGVRGRHRNPIQTVRSTANGGSVTKGGRTRRNKIFHSLIPESLKSCDCFLPLRKRHYHDK